MVNITAEHICNFETHGVELIKGLFKDYIDLIREGIEFNMENPGPYAAENLKTGEHGRFSMIIVIGIELVNLKR